ncbi:MAG: hypothetical protein ACI8Q1_000545 [Parvicella sp.]
MPIPESDTFELVSIYRQLSMKNPIIIISLLLIGFIAVIVEWNKQGDFYIFLNAGKLINQDRDIYAFNELSKFKYYYSPLFATMMSWFSCCSYPLVMAGWKLLNMFFLYRIVYLIFCKYLNLGTFSEKRKTWFYFAFFGSNLFLIFTNFQGLQLSVLIIYAVLEGVFIIRFTKYGWLGALLIALAINIKIMPIVIIPYLLFRAEYRAFTYVLLGVLFFLFVPALFIGIDYNCFLLGQWWKSINPANTEHVLDLNERGLHGISTLIATLFSGEMGGEGNLQLKRNIAFLSIESINLIINICRLIIIASTLLVFRWTPFQKEHSRLKIFAELAILLLVTPLIFPHQQSYGFLLILPAVAYCWYKLFENNRLRFRNLDFVLLCLSLFVISLPLLFGFARELFWHFKTLTYGVLLLWVVFLRIYLKEYRDTKNTLY